jgi:hypothetical protein
MKVTQHIRRALDYDALLPTPGYTITAACIKALGRLEGAGVIAARTPFYAYAVFPTPQSSSQQPHPQPPHQSTPVPVANMNHKQAGSSNGADTQAGADVDGADARVIASTDMGVRVRLAAFKAVIRTYIVGRVVDGAAWMQVVRWLLSAIVCDPSPLLKRKVIKALLKTHADTVSDQYKELENHTSPSGE